MPDSGNNKLNITGGNNQFVVVYKFGTSESGAPAGGMMPGGIRRLYIPSDLAYGDTDYNGIPGGSTLVDTLPGFLRFAGVLG